MEIVIVLAPLRKHGLKHSYTEDRTLSVQDGLIKAEKETTFLIISLNAPTPEAILRFNRRHWSIEAMYRDKDVCLGEARYTNRLGYAPKNIFILTSAVRTLLKQTHASPTTAIEIMQNSRSKAVLLIAGRQKTRFL